MQDIQKDIKATLTFIEKGYLPTEDYKKYNAIFLKTNEDLGLYYKYFPIRNGIVSTVVGSGDHILQAIKDKPKEIHAFDKNILALYLAKLKIASCQALTLNEYKTFYDITSSYFFNKIYYKKIRDYLDTESMVYWDALCLNENISKRNISFFVVSSGNQNNGKNSFEKEENYEITKNNIEKVKIEYYPLEFYDMFNNISNDKKFDAIFLSNIYNWQQSSAQEKAFLKYATEELPKCMNASGMIVVYCPPKYFFNNKVILLNDRKKISRIRDNKTMVIYKKK